MKNIHEIMKSDKMSKMDMEPDASDEDENKEGESEAYVSDLQEAMDSGDGQALYDTICAIMAAKGGAEHSYKK